MPDKRSSERRTNLIAGISLLLSIVAVIITLTAWFRPAPNPAQSDYDRVVAELWPLVQPVYEDFDIQTPAQRPATLTEVLEPLLRLQKIVVE